MVVNIYDQNMQKKIKKERVEFESTVFASDWLTQRDGVAQIRILKLRKSVGLYCSEPGHYFQLLCKCPDTMWYLATICN
jgi:hypothetical protein